MLKINVLVSLSHLFHVSDNLIYVSECVQLLYEAFQCWNIHRSERMCCLMFWESQSSFYVIFNVWKIDFFGFTQKKFNERFFFRPQIFWKSLLNNGCSQNPQKKINRFVLFIIDLYISHYFRGYMIISCIVFFFPFFCSTKTQNSLKCENNL